MDILIGIVCIVCGGLCGVVLASIYFRREMKTPAVETSGRLIDALDAIANGRRREAITELTKVLQLDSDCIRLYFVVGRLYREVGDWRRSIRIHENMLARFPDDHAVVSRSMLELAVDYEHAGLFDNAVDVLKRSLRIRANADAVAHLATLYERMGNWTGIIDIMGRDRRLHRSNEARLARAVLFSAGEEIRAGHLKNARRLIKKAPKNTSFLQRWTTLSLACANEDEKNILDQALDFASDNDLQNYLILILLKPHLETQKISFEDFCTFIYDLEKKVVASNLLKLFSIAVKLASKFSGREQVEGFIDDAFSSASPSVSLAGLHAYMNRSEPVTDGREWLLSAWSHTLSPRYRCQRCGIESTVFEWQCPRCFHWESSELLL